MTAHSIFLFPLSVSPHALMVQTLLTSLRGNSQRRLNFTKSIDTLLPGKTQDISASSGPESSTSVATDSEGQTL